MLPRNCNFSNLLVKGAFGQFFVFCFYFRQKDLVMFIVIELKGLISKDTVKK